LHGNANESVRKSAYFHYFLDPPRPGSYPRSDPEGCARARVHPTGLLEGSYNSTATRASLGSGTYFRISTCFSPSYFFFLSFPSPSPPPSPLDLAVRGDPFFPPAGRPVVTPAIFLLHATPPLAAVAAGLRHVILWQPD